MNSFLRQATLFCKRNAPTILTCVGGVGVVATSVMAVKATPKAMRLLEEAEKEKGAKLTKLEAVRTAGPAYIPAAITGVATLTCIFGANALNKRSQAALMSAYALLDNSYKEYKDKVEELYGEAAGIRVREEIAKDKYEDVDITVHDDNCLFYDYFSERYFEAPKTKVQFAEYQLNRTLVMRDYAYLNEFYEWLGIEPIESGYKYGWTPGMNLDRYWQSWVDFDHEKVVMDDGLECYILRFREEPILDFENYA